jgi:hypothetical protein
MSEVSTASFPKLEKDFAGKQAPFHETKLTNADVFSLRL